MAIEPGPQNTDKGTPSSYSIEYELKRFTAGLDWQPQPSAKRTMVLPGFLYRDGEDRVVIRSELRRYDDWNWRWGPREDQLLVQHNETYRKTLETRDLVIEKIKPTAILEIVRDFWGKGDVVQTPDGAVLTYSYLNAEPEVISGTYNDTRRHGNFPDVGTTAFSTTVTTGKWVPYQLTVEQEVVLRFGNAKFRPDNLVGYDRNAITLSNQFFIDQHDPLYIERGSTAGDKKFCFLPKEIFRTADNLGICVTTPYYWKGRSTFIRDIGEFVRSTNNIILFAQSTSQQEIMDFLAKKLKAQKATGQLPSQREALELAKIEELRKRGLFLDVKPRSAKIDDTTNYILDRWLIKE